MARRGLVSAVGRAWARDDGGMTYGVDGLAGLSDAGLAGCVDEGRLMCLPLCIV